MDYKVKKLMAITNLKKFRQNVTKFAKTLVPELQIKFQKKIAFEALFRLILLTPVVEGRAQNNWQISVETFSKEEVENWKSVNLTSEFFGVIAQLKPFQIIYLTNNVPYIEKLDGGSSKQAPNGILQPVLNQLNSIFPD